MFLCYLDIANKNKVILLFSRPTRGAFLKMIHDLLLPFVLSKTKYWVHIISIGDLLEHMNLYHPKK
jgi:hypothetical protein